MSGYLGHLVQRSLTDASGVRPRPVSIFETGQLSTEADVSLAEEFDTGLNKAAENYNLTEEGGTVPTGAEQKLSNARLQRTPVRKEIFPAVQRQRQDSATQPTPRVAVDLARQESSIPAVSQSVQPHGQASGILVKPDEPQASPAAAGTTSSHAATEAELRNTASLPIHHLYVQGKRAALPETSSTDTRTRTLSDEHQHLKIPPERTQTTRTESLNHATALEPDVRLVASPADPLRSLSRSESSVATQAILAPRLPQSESLAQPLQPSMSKAAEPVVQVTIGRIEIRAVTTPATPKRSTPPKPALSLSDYLYGRSGGHG